MKLENDYIVEAIRNLAPDAEFSFSESDLSTLKWDSTEIAEPSLEAIASEVEKIKRDETIESQNRIKQKTELLNKLGITAEEARLLLG